MTNEVTRAMFGAAVALLWVVVLSAAVYRHRKVFATAGLWFYSIGIVIGIPLLVVYVLVRFVKWAWTD